MMDCSNINKRLGCQDSVKEKILPNKVMKLHESDSSQVLPEFLLWCKSCGMTISESIEVVDVCQHRYGMKAKKMIRKGELIFDVPRSMVLWEENCSSIIPSLTSVKSNSGWVKLLLVLMLEYCNSESKWRPYLDFLPSSDVMDIPFYWEPDSQDRIFDGMQLLSLVKKDVEGIENEYKNIVLPFIEANKKFGFDKNKHTLNLYKQMVGFVMAYSFTEPCEDLDIKNSPIMVPMADVLNHVSAHNAQLHFGKSSLKMVAVKDIFPGSEIFNTYGHLSNSQLLQMYGFVENYEENKHDIVDIPIEFLKNEVEMEFLDAKWEYLFGATDGALAGCETIAVGTKGVYSYDELILILKVLCMSKSEFDSYKKQEWESDSDSNSDASSESDSISVLSYFKISSTFSAHWKSVLEHAANRYYEDLLGVLASKQDLRYDDTLNSRRRAKTCVTLCNGARMPLLGFGTYQIKQYEDVKICLDAALAEGYRAFDTAAVYKNEHHIGLCLPELLAKYNLKREDVFVTTKLGPKDLGMKDTQDAVIKSLSLLNMDYVDLYLIHWPGKQGIPREDRRNPCLREESWEVLEDIYKNSNKLRSIGVSNYTLRHMEELLAHCHVKPAVLQSEFHPDFSQTQLRAFSQQNGIHFQSYSTLGCGSLVSDSRFSNFAGKYDRTIPQVLLRWVVQQDLGVIPKSRTPDRIAENSKIFDFTIESGDMQLLQEMGKGVKYAWNPDSVF